MDDPPRRRCKHALASGKRVPVLYAFFTERRQQSLNADDPARHSRPLTRVPDDSRDDPDCQPEVSGVRRDSEEHPTVEHMALCNGGRQGEEVGSGVH